MSLVYTEWYKKEKKKELLQASTFSEAQIHMYSLVVLLDAEVHYIRLKSHQPNQNSETSWVHNF